MSEYGTVSNVFARYLGDTVEVTATSGTASVQVADAAVFANATAVKIDDTVYTLSSANVDTDVLTLGENLVADAEEDDDVLVWDAGDDVGYVEHFAQVHLEPEGANDDPVTAFIHHSLVPYLPEGVRASYGEAVRLDRTGPSTYVVMDILGQTPVGDAAYIDPTTLPSNPTDGSPPASSPTPTVEGGIGALHVRWTGAANNDAVEYEVHVSSSDGFTPGAGTLSVTTAATSHTIRNLVTAVGDPATTDLQYGTTYYVKIIAKDEDGSAAASAQGSAMLVQVTTPDIAANQAWIGTMVVDNLLGGTLDADVVLAGTLKTAESGARVEITNAGIAAYDSTDQLAVSIPTDISETNPATFRGTGQFDGLTVTDNLEVRGTSNEIAASASVTLEEGITNPTSQAFGLSAWDSITLHDTGDSWTGLASAFVPANVQSLQWSGSEWWVGYRDTDNSSKLLRFDTAGEYVGLNGQTLLSGTVHSRVSVASDDFVLMESVGNWYIWKYDPTGPTSVLYPFTRYNTSEIPHLSTDGTDLLLAEWKADVYRVQVRSAATPSTVLSTFTTTAEAATAGPVGGVLKGGSFDLGATRWVFARKASGSGIRPYNTSGTHQGNEVWPSASTPYGLAWDGSNFWTLSSAGYIYKYFGGGNTWTTESSTWWLSYTWYDSNATGGTHETDDSPKASFTMIKRARVVFVAPTIPGAGGTDDPNGTRWYLGRGASEPANSAMWLQSTEADNGVIITNAVFSAVANPPTSNNFPAGNPAAILSAGLDALSDPAIQLYGDGTYYLDPDSNLDDTGWVSFDSGVGDSPFATSTEVLCEYRRIGKLVMVRLQKNSNAARDVSGNTNGNFTNVNVTAAGAVPSAVRPDQTVECVARMADAPTTCALTSAGTIIWTGGFPANYASSSAFNMHAAYYIT